MQIPLKEKFIVKLSKNIFQFQFVIIEISRDFILISRKEWKIRTKIYVCLRIRVGLLKL